ncbi:hypothetical protein AMATHDRAFT_74675 [Amanita thiersii Skay4041]|uniref:Cryptic loci regulator 2 N-terminal domain-containing protein n=1 Tax=Amanita thiersii Skay4041 TaxID=703135 RepID=A0A2A9NTZ8_9AGAR|nr:hypothetical protein AMATHDRAFT_74675 [Amanita thiersii Skay4041]
MATRRIAEGSIEIPPNVVYIDFERTDGDPRLWPQNTICVVDDEGHVNYMHYLDIDAFTPMKWRLQVARAMALDLGMPENQEYLLRDWPSGYRMFDHNKGPAHNPRHDVYLFGSPRARFRSINEFIPHAIWLKRDTTMNNANCACKYCSKKAQKEVTASMSNILRSTPSSLSPTPTRVRSIREKKPRESTSSRSRQRERDIKTYTAIQKSPEITKYPMLVERNSDLRAVLASTDSPLRRWFREGELVWCVVDPPIYHPNGFEDASIKFWPALVDEIRLKTYATPREGVTDAYARINVAEDTLLSGDIVVDDHSLEVPWTVHQSHAYKVQLLAVNHTILASDDRILPYQAHIPSTELISALQAFPPEDLDFSREKLQEFNPCASGPPVNFYSAVAPYAMAVQIGAALSGFWSLTDEWSFKFMAPPPQQPSQSPLPPKPTFAASLQDAIDMASRHNAQMTAGPAPSSQHTGIRPPPPGAQVVQVRYQGLWWGGERIWVDEFVRLKVPRRCLAPEGAEDILAPSGPGKTARETWISQGRDPSRLGAGTRGIFMRLDGLIVVDVVRSDGKVKKECRACGMLYELADLDWEEEIDASQQAPTVQKPYWPMPEAPKGYRFRQILQDGYEAIISLSLISGRYYPRMLSHPLLDEALRKAIMRPPEQGGLMESNNLWSLEGLSAGFYNSVDPTHYKPSRMTMVEEADKVALEQLEQHRRERIEGRYEDGEELEYVMEE